MTEEFAGFPKIYRYSREVVVTEKIDGANAQICIGPSGEFLTGNRTRWITPEDDNFGFARWALDHKEELLTLGPGRYFGEWWGSKIQRTYGLKERRFSLFNVTRFAVERPACCGIVPVLWKGNFDDLNIKEVLIALATNGSSAAPGFMNPEGIVIYHLAGNLSFKKTFKDDNKGKG